MSTIEAKAVRITRLDNDGVPTGAPVVVSDCAMTVTTDGVGDLLNEYTPDVLRVGAMKPISLTIETWTPQGRSFLRNVFRLRLTPRGRRWARHRARIRVVPKWRNKHGRVGVRR